MVVILSQILSEEVVSTPRIDSTELLIVYFFFWCIICPAIAAYIGSKKGVGSLYALVGVLLGPVAIGLAFYSKGDVALCPLCRAVTRRKALYCSSCGEEIWDKWEDKRTSEEKANYFSSL